MKKFLLFIFSLFIFLPISFADVNCYSSCSDGGELSIFPNGTVCGAGDAVDNPLTHRPACFEYSRPACSPDFPFLCLDSTSCEALGSEYLYFGECMYIGDSFPPDYDDLLVGLNELAARIEVQQAKLGNFFALMYWATPLLLLMVFVYTFFTVFTFIHSIFFKK